MRPQCTKCGSNFLRLVEEHDGYYSRCMCGTFTLLQSKILDMPVNDVDLNQLDPDEMVKTNYKDRKFNKLSMAYWAVRALHDSGSLNTSTIAKRISCNYPTQKIESITKNLSAHLTQACKLFRAVQLDSYKNGFKGASYWSLGEGYVEYLAKYKHAEAIENVKSLVVKPIATTPIATTPIATMPIATMPTVPVVPSKPKTLSEILQGKVVKMPRNMEVLYG